MSNEPTLKQVWEFVKSETNPATDYEIGIMNAILGTNIPKEGWRFRKNVHCGGCKRELTILDYFLTGIQHHSVHGVKEFVSPGEGDLKMLAFQIDTDNLVKFDIADHPNPIGCVSCGHVTPMRHEVYGHPVKIGGGIHVRMPQDFFNKIAES